MNMICLVKRRINFWLKYAPYKGFEDVITEFRKLFYKYLERTLGKFKIEDNSKINGNVIFRLQNIPLFIVPPFNYGIGVWNPHISIVNVGDIRKDNHEL